MTARWRAVGGFVGAVAAVSGVLLLADAALTLLWQEPISGIRAAREQNRLERELPKQAAAALADARRLGAARDRAERAADLAARFRRRLARQGRAGGPLPTDVWVKRRVGYERLILTASHPPYSAARRLVACARLTGIRLRDAR